MGILVLLLATILVTPVNAAELADVAEGTAVGDETTFPQYRPPSLYGTLNFGAVYDTNGNFGPSQRVIRLNASPTPRAPSAEPEDDLGFYASLFLNHRSELATGAAIESSFFGLVSKQSELDARDYGSFEARTGLRVRSIKPYVLLGSSESGADARTLQAGGGVQVLHQLDDSFSLEGNVAWRRREERRKDATDFAVRALDSTLWLRYRHGPRVNFSLVGGFADSGARQPATDYHQFRIGGSAFVSVPSPLHSDALPWSIILAVNHLRSGFGADPAVDPSRRRRDQTLQASVSGNIPLGIKRISLVTGVSYTSARSNLPNYEFHNWSYQLGMSYAF